MAGMTGLRRDVQVALSLLVDPTSQSRLSQGLRTLLEAHPDVPVAVAAIGAVEERIEVTLTIGLGTTDGVKSAAPSSRAGVALLHGLVHQLAAFEPVLVPVPDPNSPDSVRARRLSAALPISAGDTLTRL